MNLEKEFRELKERVGQLLERQEKIERMIEQFLPMDEALILEYEFQINRQDSMLEELSGELRTVYANVCQSYLRFCREVDKSLNGEMNWRSAVWVGRTPPALLDAGCTGLDMHMTQKHLKNCVSRKTVPTITQFPLKSSKGCRSFWSRRWPLYAREIPSFPYLRKRMRRGTPSLFPLSRKGMPVTRTPT